MDSGFASLEPLPPTQQQIQQKNELFEQKKIQKNQLITKYNLIELASDYFNMSSYYLDPSSKTIVEIENTGPVYLRKPSYDIVQHLIQLNKLN